MRNSFRSTASTHMCTPRGHQGHLFATSFTLKNHVSVAEGCALIISSVPKCGPKAPGDGQQGASGYLSVTY